MELGNDITRVREKNDLLILFKKRIKGMFCFTHMSRQSEVLRKLNKDGTLEDFRFLAI